MTFLSAGVISVFLSAILGGLVQSTAGFGSAIVMLIFIPSFIPLRQCAAITTLVTVAMTARVAWRYRKYAKFKQALLSLVAYIPLSTLAIRATLYIDTGHLKTTFGFFMIIIALYFLFVQRRIRLTPNPAAALVCGGLGGTVSGLFGIGGPPMALYLLACNPDDKYAYLGTTQAFFCFTCMYTSLVRIANGIVTVQMIPAVIAGIVGILLGAYIGGIVVDKINTKQLQTLVYLVLIVSGTLTVLNIT